MFLTESLADPFVYVADTATNASSPGRSARSPVPSAPSRLDDASNRVYACVNGLLGFEVGDVTTGRVLEHVEAKTPPERIADVPHPGSPHGCPSHGIAYLPSAHEVWVTNSPYGYVHVFDVSASPARHVADVPLFEKPQDRPEPGWVCFSLDGRYCYAPGDCVIDTKTKRVVSRIATSEKMIEIDFRDGKPVAAAGRTW